MHKPVAERLRMLLSICLALAIFCTIALASPTDEYKNARDKIISLEASIQETEEKISSLTDETVVIEESIDELESVIKQSLDRIQRFEDQLKLAEEEVSTRQSELDDAYVHYYETARYIEEMGEPSFWSILFDSSSIADMLSNLDYISEAQKYHGQTILDAKQKRQEVEENKDVITEILLSLKFEKANLKLQQNKLYTKLQRRIKEIEDMQKEAEEYQAELETLTLRCQELMEEINRQSQNYLTVIDPAEVYQQCVIDTGMDVITPEGAEVVHYILQFYGYNYVWGGIAPETGFDCSGIVYYVYNQLGYKLARSLYDQYGVEGFPVDREELQSGDLVFFYKNGTTNLGHVGMYMGNGYFIHAANQDVGVTISSLNAPYYVANYAGARRIIGDKIRWN